MLVSRKKEDAKEPAQEPVKKCPVGQFPCQDLRYVPKSNKCGPGEPWYQKKLVPEKPFWMVDFTPACDSHDICYCTCNRTKESCDIDFLSRLQGLCTEEYGMLIVPFTARDRAVVAYMKAKLELCLKLAKKYSDAVVRWGANSYKQGQNESCTCCCPNHFVVYRWTGTRWSPHL